MQCFRERYLEVSQFFGCTFHQDCWNDLPDGSEPTMADVLREAFEGYGDSDMLELQRTFRDFLRETATLDDETVGTILSRDFDSSYDASWNGSTYRSWLEAIDEQLDATVGQRSEQRFG
jgi:hypothetical protein